MGDGHFLSKKRPRKIIQDYPVKNKNLSYIQETNPRTFPRRRLTLIVVPVALICYFGLFSLRLSHNLILHLINLPILLQILLFGLDLRGKVPLF